jgi:zinc transport system substrate-binding protein
MITIYNKEELTVRKNYLKIMLAAFLCVIMLSSCGNTERTSNSDNAKKFRIVTSFYPVYISAINVAKDIPDVEVVNMAETQTGCLHDYNLSPADIKTLESADVFVINGADMEAFMDKVTGQMPKLKIVEASKGIELIDGEGGEKNPHVWVSITNAIKQVKNIGEQLEAINPENADKYRKNTEEYVEKLEAQRDKMHKELDQIKSRDIITFHEAFPYFAKEFNLNIVAVIEREPGSEPSAGDYADIIGKVKSTGVKALFAEPQYSSKAAESIASQTGAKVYTLDPVVTGPDKPDTDAYIKAMDENLKSIKEALK